MFGSSGANELGYANSAVLIALMRELVEAKVLTPERIENVLSNGVHILSSVPSVASIDGAARIIREGIGPRTRRPDGS